VRADDGTDDVAVHAEMPGAPTSASARASASSGTSPWPTVTRVGLVAAAARTACACSATASSTERPSRAPAPSPSRAMTGTPSGTSSAKRPLPAAARSCRRSSWRRPGRTASGPARRLLVRRPGRQGPADLGDEQAQAAADGAAVDDLDRHRRHARRQGGAGVRPRQRGGARDAEDAVRSGAANACRNSPGEGCDVDGAVPEVRRPAVELGRRQVRLGEGVPVQDHVQRHDGDAQLGRQRRREVAGGVGHQRGRRHRRTRTWDRLSRVPALPCPRRRGPGAGRGRAAAGWSSPSGRCRCSACCAPASRRRDRCPGVRVAACAHLTPETAALART
jgi:hypothetical protein